MMKHKILIVTAVVFAVIFAPMSAFADFTDSGQASWAKTYIETMAEEGIVTGYEDGTFRPNDNIGKYASILMIYRTLKAAELVPVSTQTVNINKHMTTIVSKDVPNWPDMYGAVAYCLENDIIASSDLDNFQIGNTYTNARRFEVAVFLGKAMNTYLEEDLNVLYSLDFKDASSIVSAARPYVYLLNKKDIVSGDTLGYFNPDAPITRAAMAKMLAVSLDLLGDIEEPVENADDIIGVITNIIGDTNRVVIQNGADEDDIAIYNLTDVEIIIDGDEEEIDDLEIDMSVRLEYEGETLAKITVVDGESAAWSLDYEATFYKYSAYGDYQVIVLKDKDGEKFTHKTASNLVVTRDGKTADMEDLERGDYVNYAIRGDSFTEIEGFSATQEFEGVFQEYNEGDDEDTIVIKQLSGKTMELVLDEDCDIEKNGSRRDMDNLFKGDFVVVSVEYEKVVSIVASSNETEESGIIRSILISAEPKITIVTDENVEKTYDIDDDIDIEIGDDDRTIYDLRLNYSVDLVLEGGMITEINADSYEVLNKIDGTVYNIYTSSEKLKIRYLEDDSIEYIYVYVDDDTDIFSPSGRAMDFDDIDDDDKVFVYGSHEGSNYMADKIFVLE